MTGHVGWQAWTASFALHAVWQVTVLASAAWCAIRIGRPAARVSHVIWTATLLLCVVLPLFATVAAQHAAQQAELQTTIAIAYDSSAMDAALPELRRESVWRRFLHRHVSRAHGLSPVGLDVPLRFQRLLALLYVSATALFLVRWMVASAGARLIVRRSQPCTLDGLVAEVRAGAALRRIRAPEVRTSRAVAGPALAGMVRPVLLLPESASCLTSTEIDAMVAHELAHVRRRDPQLHAACTLALLPLAFHPLAWWVAHRIRQTREMACDAEAAASIRSPAVYGAALLGIAAKAGRHAGKGVFSNGLFGTGLPLWSNTGTMEERMQNLMKQKTAVSRSGCAVRLGVCLSGITVAVLVAAMVQVRPALANEHVLQQTSAPQAAVRQESDNGLRLLGGEHAQQQLRHARRQLAEAEQNATTDEQRRRLIAGRAVAAAAEQAIASAGMTPASKKSQEPLNIDLSGLNVRIVERLGRVYPQEWQKGLEAQRGALATLNSPEFRAQLDAASRIDTAKLTAMVADARHSAQEQLRLNQMERHMAEASRLTAHLEVPLFSDPLLHGQSGPLKVPSNVMAGNALNKKVPVYPPEAKEKKIQGEVVLHAIINEAGRVEQLTVVSSPDDLLSRSALEAVREWVYKPYLLNGIPQAVDTTVTVHYSFAQ